MVTLIEVEKYAGAKELFTGANLSVHPGEKVGVVGRNGAGKSTLAGLILGEIEPDSGEVARAGGLRVGHLPQEIGRLPDVTVEELALSGLKELARVKSQLAETSRKMSSAGAKAGEELAGRHGELMARYEAMGGWQAHAKAKSVLFGLGFSESDLARPARELSGGWAVRATLAKILVMEPDLIVLDEPTNHLDLGSQLWLEGFIKEAAASVVLISHDRELLDNLVEKIVEVRAGRVAVYTGNYSAYEKKRAEEIAHLAAREKKRADRIAALKEFIAKNRARKDRARQVQVRLRELEKLKKEKVALPEERGHMAIELPRPERGPRVAAELEEVGHGFSGEPLFSGVDLQLYRGDRVALVGKNGVGKTTLLKILAGLMEPLFGRARLGPGVEAGYFAQNVYEGLGENNTVFDEAATVSGELSRTQVMNLLAAFGFTGDDADKPVGVLSGGEKSRLVLVKLLMEAPNLLILDEPTNHLDIPARDALESTLASFAGTLVMVSHDRRLIDKVATRLLLMEEGSVEVFPGNLADYIGIWRKTRRAGKETREPEKPGPRESRKEKRRREAQKRQARAAAKKPLKEKIQSLEERIEELSGELEGLDMKLASPETYNDPELTARLSRRAKEVRSEMAELTERWERASLQMERVERERA